MQQTKPEPGIKTPASFFARLFLLAPFKHSSQTPQLEEMSTVVTTIIFSLFVRGGLPLLDPTILVWCWDCVR